MFPRLTGWLLLAVLLRQACARAAPLAYHEPEPRPLGVVSELGQRLASHSRLQDTGLAEQRLALASRSHLQDPPPDQRLGLPTPQEIEAIKKVAQILVMLGEQVIPTIIGDVVGAGGGVGGGAGAGGCDSLPAQEVPNDPVLEE